MMQSIFGYDMKRYLLLFLLPLYAIVDSSAYDFEKDGIYYAIKSADNLEVKVVPKAEFTPSYSGDVTIPETVDHEGNTYRVTEIFINAFADCRDFTSLRLLQPSNASPPIRDTFSGIVIDDRLVQSLNAFHFIIVTLRGIDTDSNPVQPENKSLFIDGIPSGRITERSPG